MSRKIICKIKTGSHLYGTNRPDSDQDFTGVFIPSVEDLLGLQSCPGEMSESVKVSDGPRNTAEDVDCKFYSVQKFINLAAGGQPGQLELLFAPTEMYERPSQIHVLYADQWKEILNNHHLFLSKNSVWPFVGFALAQAHKTSIKGDNLNALRAIQEWGARLTNGQQQDTLKTWLQPTGWNNMHKFSPSGPPLAGFEFVVKKNDRGYDTFRIAGRQYDPGVKLKVFLNNINDLVKRYGTRSQAAAEHGLDYKSLMHAYRLIGQAEELLTTGKITLPRPPEEVKFLMSVRNMEIPEDFDWLGDIMNRVDKIKEDLTKGSSLPETANWSRLGDLCKSILYDHVYRSGK